VLAISEAQAAVASAVGLAIASANTELESKPPQQNELRAMEATLDCIASLLAEDNTEVAQLVQEQSAALASVLGKNAETFERQVAAFDFPEALATLNTARTQGKA
jgi:hypothetical protein